MKVKIKCWNGVATWLWVANDENCGICRMAFNGCCPDCECPRKLSHNALGFRCPFSQEKLAGGKKRSEV